MARYTPTRRVSIGGHSTRGTCDPCQTVYVWHSKFLLRDAACPVCGARLRRTSLPGRGIADPAVVYRHPGVYTPNSKGA